MDLVEYKPPVIEREVVVGRNFYEEVFDAKPIKINRELVDTPKGLYGEIKSDWPVDYKIFGKPTTSPRTSRAIDGTRLIDDFKPVEISFGFGDTKISRKVRPEIVTREVTVSKLEGAFPVIDPELGITRGYQAQLIRDTAKIPKPNNLDFSRLDPIEGLEVNFRSIDKQKRIGSFTDKTFIPEIVDTKKLVSPKKKIDFLEADFADVRAAYPKEISIPDFYKQSKLQSFNEIRGRPEVAGFGVDDYYKTTRRRISPTEEILSISPRKSQFQTTTTGQSSSTSFFDESSDGISSIEGRRAEATKSVSDSYDDIIKSDNSFSLPANAKVYPALNIINLPKSENILSSNIMNSLDSVRDTKKSIFNIQDPIIKTKPVQDVFSDTKRVFNIDTAQDVDQSQTTKQKIDNDFVPPFLKFDTFQEEIKPRKPIDGKPVDEVFDYTPPLKWDLNFKDFSAKAKGLSTGYYAVVKEKGKFKRVNKIPLSKGNALSAMSRALDNTPSRTGRIINSNTNIKPKKKDNYFTKNKEDYYRNSLGGYIEKSKFAINTRGERNGITVKGWLAQKNNKRRKKAWGF
jgi:hypothetical protein